MASAEDAIEESPVTAARRSRLFRIFVEVAKLDTAVLAGDVELARLAAGRVHSEERAWEQPG